MYIDSHKQSDEPLELCQNPLISFHAFDLNTTGYLHLVQLLLVSQVRSKDVRKGKTVISSRCFLPMWISYIELGAYDLRRGPSTFD